MGPIDRKVLGILVGVLVCLVVLGMLYYANDWWLSGLMTVSIGCWLAGVLWIVYGPPERRVVLVAALAAGFLYILLALGPWFRSNVGPWLLTTRALASIETNLIGRQQPQQLTPVYQVPSVGYNGMYSGGYGGSGTIVYTVPTAVPTAAPPIPSHVVLVGHWLFAWVATGVGGCAAWWIVRHRERREAAARVGAVTRGPIVVEPVPLFPEPRAPAEGENPFQDNVDRPQSEQPAPQGEPDFTAVVEAGVNVPGWSDED
jgi:hypothetical protein